MSNLEKAAKLLIPNPRWCELVHKGEGGNPCMYCEADAEAGAVRLDDAGLITPDLPEPQRRGQELVWPLQNQGWEVTTTGEYGDESWSIHILAANKHIADVNITGDATSGYYCHSINLEIVEVTE